jgi:hypothetical protein
MISHLSLGGSPVAKDIAACMLAVALLAVSGVMVFNQTTRVRETRDLALPLAATLPPLEKRLSVLTQEVQLAEAQSAGTQGSDTEKLRMYVLPSDVPTARTIALIDTVRAALEESKDLNAASGIETGEREMLPLETGTLESQTLTFSQSLSKNGLSQLFSVIRLSGMLTVSDALTNEEKTLLLNLLESGNPADTVTLEQFLRTDLASYGQNPKAYDDKFLTSLSSPGLSETFAVILKKSALKDLQEVFQTTLGTKLREQRLFPMPLLRIQSLTIAPGADDWQKVTATVQIFGRGK